VPLSPIVTDAHCSTIGVHRCPGTSKILQWWNHINWIIDILALQISRFSWQITQNNESKSILKFKYGSGPWIEQNTDADFKFRFDLNSHSWSFSSCLYVMLLSRLFCLVTILPKSACRCFGPFKKETVLLWAHVGPCRGGLMAPGIWSNGARKTATGANVGPTCGEVLSPSNFRTVRRDEGRYLLFDIRINCIAAVLILCWIIVWELLMTTQRWYNHVHQNLPATHIRLHCGLTALATEQYLYGNQMEKQSYQQECTEKQERLMQPLNSSVEEALHRRLLKCISVAGSLESDWNSHVRRETDLLA
jgi:hypothetical protein